MKKNLVLVMLLAILFSITNLASNTMFSNEELFEFTKAKAMISEEMSSLQDILDDITLIYPYIHDDNGKIYHMLNGFINQKEYLYGLTICNDEKIITDVASSYNKKNLGLNLSMFDYSKHLFREQASIFMTTKINDNDIPMILITNPLQLHGKTIGWSIMFIDAFAFSAHISSMTVGLDINIGILDQTGKMMYDSDVNEVGRNVLDDPIYDGFDALRELIKTDLLVNLSGTGMYEFYTSGMGSKTLKHIKWDTINAFNKHFKIFINTETKSVSEKLYTDFTDAHHQAYKKHLEQVEHFFSNIEKDVESSIKICVEKGSNSEAFQTSLNQVYMNNPVVRHLYYINRETMMIERAYPIYETGIAWETFAKSASKVPVLKDKTFYIDTFVISSDYRGAVNKTIGFGVPVIAEGVLKGWVVGAIRIYELAAALLNISETGVDVNYMLLNEDGTTLFEEDIFEVGKNLYTDPIYTDSIALKTFVKDRLLTEPSGSGEYEFYGVGMTKPINKKIVWNSFEFAGSRFIFTMNLE